MDEFKEIEVVFSEEEIENFLFTRLVKEGYSPGEDELSIIASFVFDYILELTGAEDITDEE